MKRITIKDIAKLLQVSPSTVSRALADHPDISEPTRNAVKMLAEELGYKPNHLAMNFRKQHSGLIALILPEIQMFFFPQVIKGLEEVIRKQHCSLMVLHSNNSLDLEKENIDLCMQYPVDGVILSLTTETEDLEHLKPLLKSEVPILLYDRILQSDEVSTLTIDDQTAVFKAISLLINKGHQHIVGLFGDENLYISKERLKGFYKAMEHHQLPVRQDWILNVKPLSDVTAALSQILLAKPCPTAIFAMSDELLIRLHTVLAQVRMKIPRDIAIVAISEGYIPNISYPKITHVHHSGYEVGAKAGEMLLELMQQTQPKQLHHQMTSKLVLHDSV
jgi:LacI family transcriptional regulator